MSNTHIALKEWSTIVDAIGRGEQLLLVRKGGIADPGEGFQLKHREFFLYPTWEHQKPELLRPEFRARIQPPVDARQVPLQVYAGVALQKEVKDLSKLAALNKYHLWGEEFFKERQAYKPELPTQVLVVRAFRLRTPTPHPVAEEYAGCKSWVDLTDEVSFKGAEPVIENKKFVEAVNEIDSLL